MHRHFTDTSLRLFAAFGPLTLLLVLVTGAVTSVQAAGRATADELRANNAQLLELQAQARRGSAAQFAAAPRASQMLALRSALLRDLIATAPAEAEKLAFPASVLESLAQTFPAARANLEQRGRWSGELEYLIEDGIDLRSHREIFRLHNAAEVLEIRFAGRQPAELRSGAKISVGGLRSGRLVAVTDTQVVDAAQDGSAISSTGTAPYPASCTATGPQPVVSILVNLPGYSLPAAVTPDFARGSLLGNADAGTAISATDWSISDFWDQASDGRTFIDPSNTTVVGPILLNSNFNANGSCDYYGMLDAAMQAVDGQVDFRRYSRIQMLLPPNGACSWAGVANVGCRTMSTAGDGSFTASVAWERADTMTTRARAVQLGTHELGHTLGLSHASSRDFGAEALGNVGTTGTLNEYGDIHSTMGSWNLGFYAASHAANQLSWLGSNTGYQTVETSGTYSIANYEARGGVLRALKVRRGTGNDAWLWIESRQKTGLYSSQLNSSLFSGALIHYQDAATGNKSHLVDFTPATSDFNDAGLPVGQTWTDPYSNVSITVASVTADALTVNVNYGAMPCAPAAPTLTVAPTAVATEYGGSTAFTVTVKNNSSTGCTAESINLTATAPSGWATSFGSQSLSLDPGQSGQTTLSMSVPAPYALGTYGVATVAAATAGKATATENVTVVEPSNRLSLAVSGSGSVTFSSPAKTCSSNCSVDYPTATATTVTLTASAAARSTFAGWSGACTGTLPTCTLTMSTDRSVTATFNRGTSKGGGKGGR